MKFFRFLKKVGSILKEKLRSCLKSSGNFLFVYGGIFSVLSGISYCLGFFACWILNYVPKVSENESISSAYAGIGVGILCLFILIMCIFAMLKEAFRKLKDLWEDS